MAWVEKSGPRRQKSLSRSRCGWRRPTRNKESVPCSKPMTIGKEDRECQAQQPRPMQGEKSCKHLEVARELRHGHADTWAQAVQQVQGPEGVLGVCLGVYWVCPGHVGCVLGVYWA